MQKGFGLNEFAKILDISPSYLSQLETRKTENITLHCFNACKKNLPYYRSA
ncbi:MAG TPA: helix-turn-helix transcriptional regulator [Anoxybacillus sp.]|nr:helix-turn-helix transcriptional regulator [Anoxybacillus sp.]